MKSTSIVLIGLFVAQLAVAGVLYYNTASQRAVRPQGSLLSLDDGAIDQISIEGEDNSVTLEKKQESWLIASSGLPAEQSKIEQALETLNQMKLGWAVATSDASHQQLEVAEDNYQRRVMINSGNETVSDIFIGTSPGFKRSHVRKQGADDVYSAAVNAFDLPASDADWLDKALLQVSDITTLKIDDKELVKNEEKWVFDGSEDTDQEKALQLISAFEGMRVTDIATDIAAGQDELVFELITLKAGDDEFSYRFANRNDDYLLARDDIDFVFKIAKSSYDSVMEIELLSEAEQVATPSADPVESSSSSVAGEKSATE